METEWCMQSAIGFSFRSMILYRQILQRKAPEVMTMPDMPKLRRLGQI